jgi:hypothetical protein
MAKQILAIRKVEKPSLDEIACIISSYNHEFDVAIKSTRGTKKTRGVLMIMSALCYLNEKDDIEPAVFAMVPEMAIKLEKVAFPVLLKDCWRRPAANSKVMGSAIKICKRSNKV